MKYERIFGKDSGEYALAATFKIRPFEKNISRQNLLRGILNPVTFIPFLLVLGVLTKHRERKEKSTSLMPASLRSAGQVVKKRPIKFLTISHVTHLLNIDLG